MLTTTSKDKEVSLLLSTKEEKVLRVKKRARADLEKEKEAANEIDGGEDGLVGGEERARMEGRVVELRAVERNGERRREVEVDNIIITDILITILI